MGSVNGPRVCAFVRISKCESNGTFLRVATAVCLFEISLHHGELPSHHLIRFISNLLPRMPVLPAGCSTLGISQVAQVFFCRRQQRTPQADGFFFFFFFEDILTNSVPAAHNLLFLSPDRDSTGTNHDSLRCLPFQWCEGSVKYPRITQPTTRLYFFHASLPDAKKQLDDKTRHINFAMSRKTNVCAPFLI